MMVLEPKIANRSAVGKIFRAVFNLEEKTEDF